MAIRRYFFLIAVVFICTAGFSSQGSAQIFNDPQNLQALPRDTTPEELRATMRSFATSTGSRCSTCHVYENEADLRSYDFAADDKQKKLTARKMIRMVTEINSRISEIQGKPLSELVAVTCATCHRNQDKPRMLPDVLERTYHEDGLAQAMTQYRELREQYYGGYEFDFSPGSLSSLAERLHATDPAAALALLDLNLEYNPGYASGYALKADFLMKSGDKEAARESLLKAIEVEPDNQWYKQMLQRLDAG